MTDKDIHETFAHLIDPAKLEQVKNLMPDEQNIIDLSQLFGVLSDSTRLKIVVALQETELCVHEIAAAVHMSVSAVSHQLRLLKTMKLVRFRKEGKMVYYQLDDDHVKQLLKIASQHVSEG